MFVPMWSNAPQMNGKRAPSAATVSGTLAASTAAAPALTNLRRETSFFITMFPMLRILIQTCLSQVITVHRNRLKSLMTLNFQTFENESLLSA